MPFTARRLGRYLALAGTAILTLVVAIVALLQVPPVATWAARKLLALVPLNPGYSLAVGSVSGNWITGLQLEQVRLRRGERELALLERLQVSYDPRLLRGPDRRLEALVIDGGRVSAQRGRDGWDIANALQPSGDTTSSGGAFAIDRLQLRRIDVAARLGPDSIARVRGLELRGRRLLVGDTVLLTLDTLRASLSPPVEPPLWFDLAAAGEATAGEIRLDPVRLKSHRSEIAGRLVLPRTFDDPRLAERLDVRLTALPLALADLAAVYAGVPPEGDLRLEATASASGRLVTATLAARLDRGTVELRGSTAVGRGAPAVYRVHGEVRDLDPSRLHRSAPIGVVSGEVDADLRGETLPLADGSASLKLRGSRVGETELRDLDLRATVERGRADLALRGALMGGSLRADGWARPFDSVPSYRLSGAAQGLDGTEAVARALSGAAGDPSLDLRFRLAGEGVSPDEADVTGRLDLAAVRGDTGRTDLGQASLRLDRGRLELRPDLLIGGGRVRGVAEARLEDTISYRVRDGSIDSVDLGKLMGDTVVAPLSGRFTLAGRGTAPETAAITARLQLDELRYAARRIQQVIARARVEGGRATLDLRGAVQGGRLAVEATARPFDSVTTFTVRRATLDSVDLGTLLDRPDLAGPVTVGATADGKWGESLKIVRGRVSLSPSRMGRIEIRDGEVNARLSGEQLTYDARLLTGGGAIALEGDGTPLADRPTYTVRSGRGDSLDLGVLLGRDSLSTSITTRFTGSLAGSGLDSMLAKLDLELLPSRVNDADLGPGSVNLTLDRGALDGAVRLEGEDASASARVGGTVTAARSQVRVEGDGRVERLARWTGDTAADGRLETRFALDAVADSAGLVSLGGTAAAAGGVGGVRLQQLYLAFRPVAGALQLDTLVLRSNVMRLDGGGRAALRPAGSASRSDTLRIAGRAGDLTPLALLAGADSVALDSALVDLTLTGSSQHWRMQGHADAFRLLYGGNLAERITVRGAGTMDSAGIGEVGGDLEVRGAAVGKLAVREVDLTGRYDSLVSLRGTVAVNDDVSLALDLGGTARGDTAQADLRRLDLREGGRTWRLARPAVIGLRPGVVQVNGFALGAGDRRILLDGVFDRADSSDLTLQFDGLDLDDLKEARVVPVGGRLDGKFRLSGPADAPSVVGNVALAIRDGGRDVGQVESKLDWTRTGLRIDARAGHRDGNQITVAGTLPWRLTLVPEDTAATVGFARQPADTMALAVRADSFDLGLFEPLLPEATAQGLTGGLALDALVGGTPDEPRVHGTIDLRDFGVSLPTLGVTYSAGRLAGRLDGESFALDTFRLATGKDETLTAGGKILLKPLADPALDLRARLDGFRIANSDALRSVATGDLQIRGTAAKPSLTGEHQARADRDHRRRSHRVGRGGGPAHPGRSEPARPALRSGEHRGRGRGSRPGGSVPHRPRPPVLQAGLVPQAPEPQHGHRAGRPHQRAATARRGHGVLRGSGADSGAG